LKVLPKDDYEEYAKKIIDRAYFIVLNKIDALDGTNERLLKYYKENVEKY
jgi:GTPase involved in cell partitioning and DNA repair